MGAAEKLAHVFDTFRLSRLTTAWKRGCGQTVVFFAYLLEGIFGIKDVSLDNCGHE